ncbi:FMN reductase [Cronobacter turicensis 564]|nr:FMN reductase [Cronobacter turicensis 564]
MLNALKAQEILHGVFADDSQVLDYHHQPRFSPLLQTRLDDALDTFWQALTRRHLVPPASQSTRRTLHA